MNDVQWVICPICKNKTRLKLRKDTVLKNYPLFCPKCKQESLIDAEEMKVSVVKEPDAQTQSHTNPRVGMYCFAFFIYDK